MKTMKRTKEDKLQRKRIQELLESFEIDSLGSLRDFFGQILGTFLEGCLNTELSEMLGYGRYEKRPQSVRNSRNGYGVKQLRTNYGYVEIQTPRDREGKFEPQLIQKKQRCIDPEVEANILSLYGKGMTTRDIRANIKELYKVDVSESLVSAITDQVLPQAREWQNRPLERSYALVFIDAVHFTVKGESTMAKKAVYVAIGFDMDGHKDVLGLWIGEHESAKYWMSVLNEMKTRGVEDILIACMDNLKGLSDAFEATFPKTVIQKCIVHQIRNSFKFVSYKDRKEVASDLKALYQAVTLEQAERSLEEFSQKWDKKYPSISRSWRQNWDHLTAFFSFGPAIRRMIYTTNTIEGFNRQLRKTTKNRPSFPTDESLFKLLYMVTIGITKKWTVPIHNWSEIRAELVITYGERVPD